jgi:hypothetical protein
MKEKKLDLKLRKRQKARQLLKEVKLLLLLPKKKLLLMEEQHLLKEKEKHL